MPDIRVIALNFLRDIRLLRLKYAITDLKRPVAFRAPDGRTVDLHTHTFTAVESMVRRERRGNIDKPVGQIAAADPADRDNELARAWEHITHNGANNPEHQFRMRRALQQFYQSILHSIRCLTINR